MRVHPRYFSQMVFVLVIGVGSTATAVPYASGVRNTGGSNWEFVLNEAADAVTVLRDGGNALNLGAIAAGRHTFSMTGFSTFSIEVSKSAPTSWTEISDPNNLFTKFVRPNGIEVNSNPASPFFGTIYVANSFGLVSGVANTSSTTSPVRATGEGIYALTADMKGVDLSNFSVVADANDTSQAKGAAFGWIMDATDSSPWRLALDQAGNVIVSDWSDAHGGIKYATADLSSGGLILAEQDGVRPLLVNGAGKEFHGSIVSKPYVTGSVGNNLVVYGMDEDFDIDGETLVNAATGNHIWKWNVGNATSYDQPPQLVISSSPLAASLTNDPVTPHPKWLALNVGVDANMFFSPVHNKWYLTQNRNDGTEGGLLVVTADTVDGTTPTIDWSSIQWSLDNGLDSFPDDADPATTPDNGNNDVFRSMGSAFVSPDGTKLYLHRRQVLGGANNRYLGQTSNLSGNVLVVPLDANGLPVINVSDNGTPTDKTDDVITNLQSITIAGNNTNKGSHEITLDAAGNLYIGSNAAASQSIQVFSPGGNWKATTTSNGTFALTALTAGLLGDYNNNGVVDAADYVVWRDSPASLQNEGASPGVVDQADYDFWRSRFGATSGSGGAVASVPEPGTLMLTLLCIVALGANRRRCTQE